MAMEKRSADVNSALGDDFMSAMNGASRLRYGKRSNGLTNGVFVDAIPMAAPNRWAASAKRMSAFSSDSLPASIVDSLNGAERLRFG